MIACLLGVTVGCVLRHVQCV